MHAQRPASSATLPNITGRRSQSHESSITSGLLHLVQDAASAPIRRQPGVPNRDASGRPADCRSATFASGRSAWRQSRTDPSAPTVSRARGARQVQAASPGSAARSRRYGRESNTGYPASLRSRARRAAARSSSGGRDREPVAGLAGAELAGLPRAEVEPRAPAPGHRRHPAQRAGVLPRQHGVQQQCRPQGVGPQHLDEGFEPREESRQPPQPVVRVSHLVKAEDQRVHWHRAAPASAPEGTSRC